MSYLTSSQHSQGLPADLLGYQNPVRPSFTDSGALWHLVRSWAHAAAHVNHFQMTFDSCFNVTAVRRLLQLIVWGMMTSSALEII